MSDEIKWLTLEELKKLFVDGILKEKENDYVIFDKGDCDLITEKPYTFSMTQSDAAYILFEDLNIPAEGA